MKPVEILQGKWLGHPLHPALVHIPVGSWIGALVFDLIGHDAVRGATLPFVGFGCVAFGLAGALLAVPTGVADWSSIKKERPAWKLGLIHMGLNLVAAVIWAANLGLRWRALDSDRPIPPAVLLTSAIGVGVLLMSGYIGSLMVADHGVGVARESKKKWRAIAQRGGARVTEEKSP